MPYIAVNYHTDAKVRVEHSDGHMWLRVGGHPDPIVTSIFLTSSEARRIARELLDAADEVDALLSPKADV